MDSSEKNICCHCCRIHKWRRLQALYGVNKGFPIAINNLKIKLSLHNFGGNGIREMCIRSGGTPHKVVLCLWTIQLINCRVSRSGSLHIRPMLCSTDTILSTLIKALITADTVSLHTP
ncbi:hypothetical protein AVEN_13002-1 [Araneus ventricosus]|uniref:Uncharacterized protein n=1 Tax=Araneus ventricosus TaxID=182803 RepID=A0A4Y2HM20_ARAVE|nr:hypothetical protein AVEN_13002-1 [Araneus ventricosus]